jgi:hypothetical protein
MEETKSERRIRLSREAYGLSIPEAVARALNRNREGDERKAAGGSLLGRPFMAGTGLAAFLGYAPVAKAQALGETELYHGTPAVNVPRIVESGGLKQKFAGKIGRINAYMQPNAILNAVEDSTKVVLTNAERSAFMEKAYALVRKSEATKGKVAFSDEIIREAHVLAKEKGLKPEQLGDLNKKLNNAGRRIYFGLNPESVRFWGTPEREADAIMKGLAGRAGKSAIRNLPSALIGGLDKIIRRDIVGPIKLGLQESKVPHEKVTVKDLPKVLRKASKEGQGAILRTVIPTKTLGVFKDFPVVGHVVAMNRPLQDVLADISVQTYSPGRDFSIAQDVPAKNIRKVTLTDAEKYRPQTVLEVIDAKRPRSRVNFSGVRKALLPSAIAYGGAELISKALTGKSIVRRILGDREKTAGLSFSTKRGLLAAGKAGGIGAGIAGAVGLPIYLLSQKSRKERESASVLRREAFHTGYGIGTGIAQATAPAVAAGAASLLGGGVLPSMTLSGVGGLATPFGLDAPISAGRIRSWGAKALPMGGLVQSEKADELVRKNADEVALATGMAIPAALGGGVGWTLRKHYWGSISPLLDKVPESVKRQILKRGLPAAIASHVVPVAIGAGLAYSLPKILKNRSDEELDKGVE